MTGRKDQGSGSSSSLLIFFCSEVETLTEVVRDGLHLLKSDPGVLDSIDAIAPSLSSLRGGALLVESDPAVKMIRSLGDCLARIRETGIAPAPDQVELLLEGVEMLREIARAVAGGNEEWLEANQESMENLLAAIGRIHQSGIKTAPLSEGFAPVPAAEPSSLLSHSYLQERDVDLALLDFFRSEVETIVAVLNEGLLALEEDPFNPDCLMALMRGAHSLKGGARIVGLDPVVRIAHAMEDCFVAAQKGNFLLNTIHIDILLKGVDCLSQVCGACGESDGPNPYGKEIEDLVESVCAIGGAAHARLNASSQDVFSHASDGEGKAMQFCPDTLEGKPSGPIAAEKDRMVRVTAAKIERLMDVAGESVVNARRLPSFSQSFLSLKKSHMEMYAILDKLQDATAYERGDGPLRKLAQQMRQKLKECNAHLADKLNQLDTFASDSATISDRLYHEVIGIRMRPFDDAVRGFPRMVRDLARELGKKVRLEIVGRSTEVDRDILEKLDAPLNHLLRNALDHGIESPEERLGAAKPETATMRLQASHRSGMLRITLSDDGRGVDPDKLKRKIVSKGLAGVDMLEKMTELEIMDFLFLPGFTTAENVTRISGRGVGLDVVRNMVQEVGGSVRAVSKPGAGMSFHLELPLTLSVVRTFVVEVAGEPYAFPLSRLDRCLVLSINEVEYVEDRQFFRSDGRNISIVSIYDVLDRDWEGSREELPVVVVSDRVDSYGLVVDRFLGECDLVARPLDPRMGKVPDLSSVAIMLDGSPVLIFDVEDLLRSIDNLLAGKRLRKVNPPLKETGVKKRILVVDDSITVREMERKILQRNGYEVELAVDGADGWNAVRTGRYDLVITDVDMPRMNGFDLVAKIKQHAVLKSLPVIIVSYKDREEDRVGGLAAGAGYYLTKSSFEDDSFINAVVDLIGEG